MTKNNGWHLLDGTVLETPPTDAVGFVYRITRISDGKFYIGKKKLTFKRSKMVNGKKKRFTIDSDWLTYYGSSDDLKNDVKSLGADSFHREILHICKTLSQCNYLETKEIFSNNCLLREDCYNSWVSVRINRRQLKSMQHSS